MSGRRFQGNRSFTLIEVTLGLAILILIFGVLFQLVQMSMLGADAAAKNSQRTREVSGLFALLRQLCLDLPVRSQLSFEPRSGGGYDLLLSNPPLVILPEQKDGARSIRFALQKDPVSGGGVLVLQEIFQATNEMGRQNPPETNSFELMREVGSVIWLAGDPRNPDELREWNDPIKPAYLRMTLVRRDGQRKITNSGIFYIPTGYSPSGQVPADPITRVPMNLTNQTNQG
jgi:hypothetical protein